MPEPDKILRMRTVLQRTGLSRSTIYRKIKDGTFPAQLRISVNGCGWRESEINRWMADPENYRTSDGKQAKRPSPKVGAQKRTTQSETQSERHPMLWRPDGVS